MTLWTVFCRAGGIAAVWILLHSVLTAKAETTNGLSEAEIKGRELAHKLRDAWPEGNLTNTGVLHIRDGHGKRTNIPVTCLVIVGSGSWQSIYESTPTNLPKECPPQFVMYKLSITHAGSLPPTYRYAKPCGPMVALSTNTSKLTNGEAPYENPVHSVWINSNLSGQDLLKPFADSDFWVCDLGMEFFHWPAQKVLPNDTRLKRGRAYTKLESTNPNPPTNGYSRVITWIDVETGGILQAEAYDAKGEKLKEFYPNNFKKVNGQWELKEMEIDNVQTDSSTRLEFDLKK
jgi:hypothetical protein